MKCICMKTFILMCAYFILRALTTQLPGRALTFDLSPQARIAFLQGERKGQENLKNDLVRRIKMLEYALKQER